MIAVVSSSRIDKKAKTTNKKEEVNNSKISLSHSSQRDRLLLPLLFLLTKMSVRYFTALSAFGEFTLRMNR